MGGTRSHSQIKDPSRRFPQDQGRQGGTGLMPGRPWQIPEYYEQVYEITAALARAGFQPYNLILGIDFTKGNEQTAGRSLHDISSLQNPYEQVISIIGRTLSRIDQDNLLPCFGFGDASTNDEDIFSFYPGERPCNGLSGALNRYRELTPHLRLAGPTSFAPIIDMAISIVERSGRQYHVLLIIANAQVMTRVAGRLSFQESQTINAIVAARKWPLSIVLIGVGDHPEDMVKDFVHKIPPGDFDNFHHVNISEIMSEDMPQAKKEAAFALSVLMKLPQQYRAVKNLGLLGRSFQRIPRPPPVAVGAFMETMSNSLPQSGKEAALMEEQHDVPPKYDACSNESESGVCLHCGSLLGVSPPDPEPNDTLEPENTEVPNEFCTVCQARPKDMVFGCGHQVCCDCGPLVESCPFCRCPITIRIKLY